VSETAVIVIPEEAEAIIPILREAAPPAATYLMTYSAPVTRKMMKFNDLTHYTIPPLPQDWTAPQWLRIELGLFAGRLYFEWDEYEPLCKFIGIDPTSNAVEDFDSAVELTESDTEASETNELAQSSRAPRLTKRPLTFLQEWLAVRRRGQDFVYTPMGFITHGKGLHENHPFFSRVSTAKAGEPVAAPVVRVGGEVEEDEALDDFFGVDDMGENVADAPGAKYDDNICYDEDEFETSS